MTLLRMLGNARALLQRPKHRHCQSAIACSRNNGFWWLSGRVRWWVNTSPELYRREHNPGTAGPGQSKPGLCTSISKERCLPEGCLFTGEALNQYTGTKESSNANRSSIQMWNPSNVPLASKTPSVTHSPMKRAVSEVIFIYNVFVPHVCLGSGGQVGVGGISHSFLFTHSGFRLQSSESHKAATDEQSKAHIYLHQNYITYLL